MQRLFAGLRLPRPLREAVLSTMDGVPGARWQRDDQLHCTLAFIGEVDRHQAEDIDAALANIRGEPPGVALSGAGMFGKPARPTSLWVGVVADEALVRLQRSVARALLMAGVPFDQRAYRPHVTAARLGRTATAVEPWIARHAALRSPAVRVDEFTLFESQLGSAGAYYEPVGLYRLN